MEKQTVLQPLKLPRKRVMMGERLCRAGQMAGTLEGKRSEAHRPVGSKEKADYSFPCPPMILTF